MSLITPDWAGERAAVTSKDLRTDRLQPCQPKTHRHSAGRALSLSLSLLHHDLTKNNNNINGAFDPEAGTIHRLNRESIVDSPPNRLHVSHFSFVDR
ncbi:uncharacterized protein CLUP02_05732 [Colletotrichum lupini]|uniref:Uncharacterized protein n=1 Tax=Colletotrichum lupini TaxID=145971 RepID=A0A9Q8SN48_9PEZI|nr:uncharacterized protein CLUP02_05732 [Colletotrichum lupini]UQC80250.1 hypothetical protein CLUP02_05732 [Colletotrichum lupini]